MKIVLIGYGKMGKLIAELALQKEHQVIAKIHGGNPLQSADEDIIRQADVCIDFSTPQSVMGHIRKIASLKKNLVMGTTGWYDHLEEVRAMVNEHQIGFLFSPNFSIGVHLFKKIVEEASQLMNEFDDYDVGGLEQHHNQKEDSPSGTTKSLVFSILEKFKRKKTPVYDLLDRPIAPQELHFPSLRCGFFPGTHSVIFDSPVDTITLTHQARNREGFARGAILAAEWLEGKKGFFTLDDMIQNMANPLG